MSSRELKVKLTWMKENGTPREKICSLVLPEGINNEELCVIKSISKTLFACDNPLEEMVHEQKTMEDVKVLAHWDNKYELKLESKVMRLGVQLTAIPNKPDYQYLCEVQSLALRRNDELESTKFAYLFDSQLFSDLTIHIEDKSIYAHKIIVADKSAYFRGFFRDGKGEQTTSSVRIINAGFGYETMVDLLFYIYNGTTSRDDSNHMFWKYSNLLKADNQFVVDGLRDLCEVKLSLILKIENVVDCLLLADSCNAVRLKWQAINYFVENADQLTGVLTSDQFSVLHPEVLKDIVRALVEKNKNIA